MKNRLLDIEFVRFAIVGTVAFIIHYAIYLLLSLLVNINLAYSIGYGISLFCNFILSAKFTFRSCINTWKSFGFVFAHAINYLLHMVFLNLLIIIGINDKFAPLIVVCLVVPINFVMVRFVFRRND